MIRNAQRALARCPATSLGEREKLSDETSKARRLGGSAGWLGVIADGVGNNRDDLLDGRRDVLGAVGCLALAVTTLATLATLVIAGVVNSGRVGDGRLVSRVGLGGSVASNGDIDG